MPRTSGDDKLMARGRHLGTMVARSWRWALVAALVLLLSPAATVAAMPTPARDDDIADGEGASREWVNSTAYISTNFGNIVATLADLDAPITVGNFAGLADDNFYDNMKWHRIVDDFVIQTGDPNSRDNNPYNDGTGGSTQTIQLEISENLTHLDGALGMARSTDPNSASSQFYICDGAQHGLDGDYAVFGFVVEGMDVVRAIASVEVYGNRRPVLSQHPVDDVWLYDVEVEAGYWNETEAAGPTEPVVPAGVFGGGSGVGGALLVAVAVIVVVGMFAYWRIPQARRFVRKVLRRR